MVEQPQSEPNQPPEKQPGIFQRLKKALNFKKMSRSQAAYTILFLIVVGLMIFIYVYTYLGEFTEDQIGDSGLLTTIIMGLFIQPIVWLGVQYAILIFLGIMLLQCIIAPIPSEFVQIIGGLLFGIFLGGFLSYAGIMVTAFIGYYIAIRGGASVIGAAIGEKNVKAMERFIGKYGIWAMIVGRGIPYIPFDLVTYGSGLVKMGKKDYVIGTLIGTGPRSFFYSYIGSRLGFILFGEEVVGLEAINKLTNAINSGAVTIEGLVDQVSGDFNFILTLTILIVVVGFAVFYFIVLPYMRRKVAREEKRVLTQTPA